jgi:hypothetical protein
MDYEYPQSMNIDFNYPLPLSSAHSNVTEALVGLLTGMPLLERLALSVGGSPTARLIHVFEKLQRVRKFELANWADEVEQPLYVLCIAFFLHYNSLISDFPLFSSSSVTLYTAHLQNVCIWI